MSNHFEKQDYTIKKQLSDLLGIKINMQLQLTEAKNLRILCQATVTSLDPGYRLVVGVAGKSAVVSVLTNQAAPGIANND